MAAGVKVAGCRLQVASSYLRHATFILATCLLALAFPTSCTQSQAPGAEREPVTVQLTADGDTETITTGATTVRELLSEHSITLNDADEVEPPLFTPLEAGMDITVVRVTEELVVIPQSIPFERKIVRNESMDAEDPPVIVQAGGAGLQEATVRIVYRDGLEAERWQTQVNVIEEAQDEIVMVGIGAARGNLSFAGSLAVISDGTAVIYRGSTAFPERLNTGGPLDGRVFSLSPTGSHLLYTRTSTQTARFNNSLWVVATERNSHPRPLDVHNVLWADWNPARTDLLQIAYTTAISTTTPPGWEANNDLWLGEVARSSDAEFEPEQLVESYPATFGWWGGNYAWSPNGRFLAYSYADEVGVIDLDETGAERRRVLHTFTEYNTLSDWVWVPTLTWSPDGRFLAFTGHTGPDAEALRFDSWVYDVATGINGRFVQQIGMWGHLHWAPAANVDRHDSHIAYLQTMDPLNSLRSGYTLWLMDRDGSNKRQIYPPPGENSHFPQDPHFMAWGPTGHDIAFIFNGALYIYNLDSREATRVTQDDARTGHPTWAPYGTAVPTDLPATQPDDAIAPTPESGLDRFLPDE